MIHMKEQIKAPKNKKIQLSDEEIANLSDAEFKTLVIRMLHELTGYFKSIKRTQAAMKVALCEIKKNVQGTNSERKETRTQINNLDQKEDNQNRMKKQEFKEMKRGLGTFRTTLNIPTSKS